MKYTITENRLVDFVDKYLNDVVGELNKVELDHINATEGDFEIVDQEGNIYDLGGRTVISLCRCGLSKEMPFCDSRHKGEFINEAKAFALPPKKNNT